MEWGVAKNLIWLWVLPAGVFIFYLASWRKRSQMRAFGEVALVERLISSFDPRQRLKKRLLILTAFLCMALALAQPHFRTKEIQVERRGIDVMIAVDVSKSMLAKDIPPNRLEKAKLELTTLIDRLKQDRIGIVAFAGEAFIQCPLTLDKGAVKIFLSTLNPNIIPTPGTAIGSAIRVATQAFTEKEKEFKALVLLTDGEDHDSNPLEAARKAKQAGVKVFTIGVGTSDGSTLPGESAGEGFKKDKAGRPVLSKLDEPLLRDIAKETGGVYYRSSRGEVEVDALAGEIRKMSQKGLKSERSMQYEESFQTFVAIALFLLFIEMAISERKNATS